MLRCPRCTVSEISTYASLVTHLIVAHGNEPNFSVFCNLQNVNSFCCSVFRTAASYKSHMHRFHSALMAGGVYDATAATQAYKILCPVCNISISSLRELGTHYRDHCIQGMNVPCVVKHCQSTFDVISSYSSHMVRKHRNVCFQHVRDECKYVATTNLSPDVNLHECDIASADTESVVERVIEMPLMTRNIALMLLKMKTQYSIPDTTVQLLIGDFSNIVDLSSSYAKQQIMEVTEKYSLCPEIKTDLYEITANGCWKSAIEELSTDWKRNAYYRRNFPYVAPVEYKFVDRCDCKDSFQYIPMTEMLAHVLKDENVRSQLLNPKPGMNGHLQSFRDGNGYKKHPVFSLHSLTLELIIYSDEFEIVNPLGPHKKKHNMMAFYLLLGNLYNTSKAQKSAILLLALGKSVHMNKYGLTRVAEVINRDLMLMENEGLEVDDYPVKIHGALAFIAGDNLNSHIIGGFNASFSPNVLHPCRFCSISNDELQKCDHADDLQLRTRGNYDEQAVEVIGNSAKCTQYGIRYSSPFISGSFHVVDGLPPDIMHDLLEGVVPFEMALVLKKLVEAGSIKVDELNSIILNWNYGPLDKSNKPVALQDPIGDIIKQNAGRTWCLLRLLPLMIGHKVMPNSCVNTFWTFLLELRAIVELIFAPRLAIGHVLYLKTKIEDHVAKFKALFPDKNLKPKHHLLLHYPYCFFTFGPLRSCWCMRFEAKHSYFTRLMTCVNNYKNACSTLAQRHQMKLAYELATGSKFLCHEISLSATISEDMSYLADCVIQALLLNGVSPMKRLYRCSKFADINGVTYYCKMYVVLGFNDDNPLLGRIDNIYIQEMKCHFLTRICLTNFDDHLGAYCIHPAEDVTACTVEDLVDYYPLTGYIVGNERVVALKNFVYDCSLFTD
jgi:hypothetical protein